MQEVIEWWGQDLYILSCVRATLRDFVEGKGGDVEIQYMSFLDTLGVCECS